VINLVLKNKGTASKELLRALAYFCALDNLPSLERCLKLIGDEKDGAAVINVLLSAGDPLIFQSIFRTLFFALQVFTGRSFEQVLVALRRMRDAFVAKYHAALSNGAPNPPDAEWLSEFLPLAAAPF
jgi:hypothetical protein